MKNGVRIGKQVGDSMAEAFWWGINDKQIADTRYIGKDPWSVACLGVLLEVSAETVREVYTKTRDEIYAKMPRVQ